MKPIKLIVSHKGNLQWKYGRNFSKLTVLLKKMQAADARKGLDTKIFYIDNATSLKGPGVRKINSWSEEECKRVVDELYGKYVPAYIIILGAQDIIPFQDIDNPTEDADLRIPSDLPYACDTEFSRRIENFTGPTRVVGRIPDIPGQQETILYLERVIKNCISYKPVDPDKYRDYFSLSAWELRKSTELSLQSMFGTTENLLISPAENSRNEYKPFTKKQLEPMTHFYNCHGANLSANFYGQKNNKFPEALLSSNLTEKITNGTIVASECCFGAQLFDPVQTGLNTQSIANNYLANDAVAFLGSSTIAYGPTDSQGLADVLTQYFIKNVLKGASTGRAFLEARQQFLSDTGPDLDPYELKTITQFYLLGDPSVQPANCEDAEVKELSVGSAIANSRKNLSVKGQSLKATIVVSEKQSGKSALTVKMPGGGGSISITQILKKNQFSKKDKKAVYNLDTKMSRSIVLQDKLGARGLKFHTYIQDLSRRNLHKIRVLVVKANATQILGWRVYKSR